MTSKDEIHAKMKNNPALTPLHWVLIDRALSRLDDPSFDADKTITNLLTEPLRALRTQQALLTRIHEELSNLLETILTPEQKRELARQIALLQEPK